MPRDFPWPVVASGASGASADGADGDAAPGGPWYVAIEKFASDGKGKVRALVDLAHFGRTGIVPLIAEGVVGALLTRQPNIGLGP